MDKKSEVVHAVRVTNAKIDSSMEIDPDAIAASADFFCYSGGTAKVHVIGKKEYQMKSDGIYWIMNPEKSFEEERLSQYYRNLMAEMQLPEPSFFNTDQHRDLKDARNFVRNRKNPVKNHVTNGGTETCISDLSLSTKTSFSFGSPSEQTDSIFLNIVTPEREDSSKGIIVCDLNPSDEHKETNSSKDAKPKAFTSVDSLGKDGSVKAPSTHPIVNSEESDQKPTPQTVDISPKPDTQNKINERSASCKMEENSDKPSEGVEEIDTWGKCGHDIINISTFHDTHPTLPSMCASTLGQYEKDVEESVISILSSCTGLTHLRNPFDAGNLSLASPSDTLVGIWDIYEDLVKTSRILPHGKGKLCTADNKVIYVGDFKYGKRHGFGTALIVDISFEPHHGVGYYQGNWMNNCRHGSGSLYLVSGMRYAGSWYLDKPHGRGMLVYPDGSILKGHFAGGLNEGGFTYYSSEGYIELQEYRGGCLIARRPLEKLNENTGPADQNNPLKGFERCLKKTAGKVDKQVAMKKVQRAESIEPKKSRSLLSLRDIRNEVITGKSSCHRELAEAHHNEESSEEHVHAKGEDPCITGEIDLDWLLEHLLHTVQLENEFFINTQMSKVKICCDEMLVNAQMAMSEVTERHMSIIEELPMPKDTRDMMKDLNLKIDQIAEKFDGVLDVCRSILDKQDGAEKRISALDVHVAEFVEAKEKSETESLKKALKKKDEELIAAEGAMNCQICQDRPRDCVLMPCMHMHTCHKCINEMRNRNMGAYKCPICRSSIQAEIRLKLT